MDRPAVRSAHTRIRVLGLCVGISLQVLVFWPSGLNGLVDGVVLPSCLRASLCVNPIQ